MLGNGGIEFGPKLPAMCADIARGRRTPTPMFSTLETFGQADELEVVVT
ncbi:MAG: hypothetical protein ACREML_06360 [Vulcanimicrobiaceae bacterium]